MAVPQTSSRAAWAQAYAQNPENGHVKAECQHANMLRQVWTVGAEAAHAQAFSLQVSDLYGTAIAEVFQVRLKLAGTKTLTYALVTGTAVRTVKANEEYDVLTDANGVFAFTLTHVAGATTGTVEAHIAQNVPECDWNGCVAVSLD